MSAEENTRRFLWYETYEHRMTELTVRAGELWFILPLTVSLLRYSHDGFRARKGEEDCLQFITVYSVHDQV